MPTRKDPFMPEKVGSEPYENASEVVRAALQAAIDEGDASGVAEGDVFARVRQDLNLPAEPR